MRPVLVYKTCSQYARLDLLSSTRASFELFDLGHVCGNTLSVLAFARAIAALRLGAVVVFRHVRLLCLCLLLVSFACVFPVAAIQVGKRRIT